LLSSGMALVTAGSEGVSEKVPLSNGNYLNVAAYVVSFAVTWGFAVFTSNSQANEEREDEDQTFINPKGVAFSIWGVIFLLELSFVIAQMLPRYRSGKLVRAITPWWCATCITMCLWTFCFNLTEWLTGTMFAMISILLSLVCLLLGAHSAGSPSLMEEFVLLAGFKVHAGWIICANAIQLNISMVASRPDRGDLDSSQVFNLPWSVKSVMILGIAALALAGVVITFRVARTTSAKIGGEAVEEAPAVDAETICGDNLINFELQVEGE